MDFLSPDWQQAYWLLDEALAVPQAERAQWLKNLDNDRQQARLRPLLEKMLADRSEIETKDFLASTAHFSHLGLTPIFTGGARLLLDTGQLIGPYRLIRELGIGGMGAVWLAERADGKLKRKVALKLPHIGLLKNELAKRFERERDILAALVHPKIARLYDAGTSDAGQPYIALEYVEGTPIIAHCNQRKLGIKERLVLFRQVLDAVQFAHANLVIHRDLKPANIFVTADGYVRLLDFGIAKFIQTVDELAVSNAATEMGARALTPDYASPEQIAGDSISTASDVYSLGVVLYELLAGARPYKLKRDTRGALEDAILTADPKQMSCALIANSNAATVAVERASSVAKLRRELDGDLNTIVFKAIKKRPQDRYLTVAALLEDVDRYFNYQPILAKAESIWYGAKKFAQRNTVVVGAAAAVLFTLVAGLVATVWQMNEAAHQATAAVTERKRAEVATALAETERKLALVATARAEQSLTVAQAESGRALAANQRMETSLEAERRASLVARSQTAIAKQQTALALVQSHVANEQTRLAKAEAERASAVQGYIVDLFKTNTTAQSDPVAAQKTTVRELLDRGMNEIDTKLDGQPQSKAALLATFTAMYTELGLRDQMVAATTKSSELATKIYGEKSDQAFDQSIAYLNAQIAGGSREFTADETASMQAVYKKLEATLNGRNDFTSERRSQLNVLACLVSALRSQSIADTSCQIALDGLRKYNAGSPTHLEVLLQYADGRRLTQRYQEQELLAREALDIVLAGDTAVGDHATTYAEHTAAYDLLLSAQLAQYKMREAEKTSQALQAVIDKSNKPLSATMMRGIRAQAGYLCAVNRHQAARQQLEAILKRGSEVYTLKDSLALRAVATDLAGTLSLMGETKEAVTLYQRIVEAIPAAALDSSAQTSTLVFYGVALTKHGNYPRARVVLTRANDAYTKANVKEVSPLRGLAFCNLAEIELAEGRPDLALAWVTRAQVVSNVDPEVPTLQRVRKDSLTTRILVALGRVEEADALITPLQLTIVKSSRRSDLAALEAMALSATSSVALALNQPRDAVDMLKRAIALSELREVAASPRLAELNLELAKALRAAGEAGEAMAVLAKIKQLRKVSVASARDL